MILEMGPVKWAKKKFLESGSDSNGGGGHPPLEEGEKWVNHSI